MAHKFDWQLFFSKLLQAYATLLTMWQRRLGRMILLNLLALTLVAPWRLAHAQALSNVDQISLQQFLFAPSTHAFLSTQSGRIQRHLQLYVGLLADYARTPFTVSLNGQIQAVVQYQIQLDLALTLGIGNWVELGIDAPMVLQNGLSNQSASDIAIATEFGVAALSPLSPGDLRFLPKLKIGDWFKGGLAMAVLAELTVPVVQNNPYVSESGANFVPQFLLSSDVGPVRLGLNFGYHLRHYGQDLTDAVMVSDEWVLKGALALDLSFGRTFPVELVGEMYGRSPVNNFFGGNHAVSDYPLVQTLIPLEIAGGLRIKSPAVIATVAVGQGLLRGYGEAGPRVVANLAYQWAPPLPPIPLPPVAEQPPAPPQTFVSVEDPNQDHNLDTNHAPSLPQSNTDLPPSEALLELPVDIVVNSSNLLNVEPVWFDGPKLLPKSQRLLKQVADWLKAHKTKILQVEVSFKQMPTHAAVALAKARGKNIVFALHHYGIPWKRLRLHSPKFLRNQTRYALRVLTLPASRRKPPRRPPATTPNGDVDLNF